MQSNRPVSKGPKDRYRMEFRFSSRHVSRPYDDRSSTFRVDRLVARRIGDDQDVSHLIDSSYDYQSQRELQWHLAERFELPVKSVRLASL
jgi:spore coat polysaccharide biosynthesis protein SpsF (cytidylyltransferase family)